LKQLIINADDFGLTAGVSRGILHAMRKGIVSSTSAMVCNRAAAVLARASDTLSGRVGLHLQLTDGSPCSTRCRSLVTRQSRFPRFPEHLGTPDPDEIRIEWQAQLDAFLRSGLTPSHIDTHHNVHAYPVIFEVYCEVARRCGVPARTLSPEMTESLRSRGIPCADCCETAWLTGKVTQGELLEQIIAAFDRCGGRGVIELACHPGSADRLLSTRSFYISAREEELRILCSDQLARRLRRLEVEIIGMADTRIACAS
jgi:predicted glycoside hydrolase/deacetylase ChbG (UPF0249 family)